MPTVTIEGPSMQGAGLEPGMRFAVRPQPTADHGQIVAVAQADGGIIVKRYHQTRPIPGFAGGWLVPEHPDYKPRPMMDGDRILGVLLDLPEPPLPPIEWPEVFPASWLPVALVPRATEERWHEARYRRARARYGG